MSPDEPKLCVWDGKAKEVGLYETDCAHTFGCTDSGPELVEYMKHCCFCGRYMELWMDGRRQ